MTVVAALLALLAAAQAEPVLFEQQDEQLEFTYGWPSVVEEEPALLEQLEAERTSALAQARKWAAEDRETREGAEISYRHSYSKVWAVAGAAPPLLSLTAYVETYTGGAHGGLAVSALLWDRSGDRAVEPGEVLGDRGLARIEPRFCDALDAMREERRNEPVQRDPSDSFTACLPLAEQTLAPADVDGNGRFDTLLVLVPPYAAGPWVEGPYDVEVPLDTADLIQLPAGYRAAFEAGRAGAQPQ